MLHTLDNPVWSALTTRQAHFAEGDQLARRYPAEVTSLGAVQQPTPDAFESLARATKNDDVGLFCFASGHIPEGWKIVHVSHLVQMICVAKRAVAQASSAPIEKLTAANTNAMVGLATLTNPGPFGKRSQELGLYLGICQQGQLVSMAGERLRLPRYTEVSAVCTHPDFQGRGYARTLISAVTTPIFARGEMPFLHVRQDNAGAIGLYEKLGFKTRAILPFYVLRHEPTLVQTT